MSGPGPIKLFRTIPQKSDLVIDTSSGSSSFLARKTVSVTTPSIAANVVTRGTVALGKTFSLLSLTASGPCRIQLYSTAAAMYADASRNTTTVPSPFTSHGVIADIVLGDTTQFPNYSSNSSLVVAGTTSPWAFTGGINSSFSFGSNDGTSPIVAASGLTTGNVVIVSYVSGGIVAGTGVPATTDGIGNPNAVSNNGTPKPPDYYIAPFGSGGTLRLCGIIGAFTDASGNVISVIEVGNYVYAIVPAGATQFQVGINDNVYADNTGSVTVSVVTLGSPRTWVCSPEALGSDCETTPTGNINYVITNLASITTPVTVSFNVITEES